jgi:uncharacterized protein (TIGR03435 family)
MVRAAVVLALIGGMAVVSAQSTAPAQGPAVFEVASIKPVAIPPEFGGGGFFPGGRFAMSNATLRRLIQLAYDLEDYQVVNAGPKWIESDLFAVDAKAANGFSPSTNQVRSMIQNLLAERFKLIVRREVRDMPMYTMVFARADQRLGPQLRQSQMDCSPEGRRKALSVLANGRRPCAMMMSAGFYAADGVEFSQLTNLMANEFARPVTDRTGLSGLFDWELKWAWSADADGPALLTAFEEQLGLKLETGRGPVEVLVIESAERPTPN